MHALEYGHVPHMRASIAAHSLKSRTQYAARHLPRRCSCQSNADIAWLVNDGGKQPSTHYDAVIVLGGGLEDDGRLPRWVTRRLDTAAGIWRIQERRCPILCLGGGTPHKPAVLTSTHHVLHEATSCAEYLQARQGVHARHILKETSSYDTVGNGFFALTIHAIPACWRTCAVVTSAFHMPRTRAIFEHVFLLGGLVNRSDTGKCSLRFYAASDEELFPSDVIDARLKREAKSLQEWRARSASLHSLKDMHAWLHSEHLCYSVARQEKFGSPSADDIDDKVLASY